MGENKYARMAEIAQQLHGTEPEPEISSKRGRPPGKRSNPNFERLTVLVKKSTRDAHDYGKIRSLAAICRSWSSGSWSTLCENIMIMFTR